MNIGDAIELVKDLPEKKLYSGMQGTIVDRHSDAYEIEFTTPDGETIDFLSLTPENFILTWTIENKKFVSAKNQAIQLIKLLPNQITQQVLDFIKFKLFYRQKFIYHQDFVG
jgi:hypothetical protein